MSKRSRVFQMEKGLKCEVKYSSGIFSYVQCINWVKWPHDMGNMAVCGIACDKEGKLIVATRSEKYPICFLDEEGNFLKAIGHKLGFKRTHGITIDLDGNLWCCDDQNSVIYHLDKDGNVLEMLGEKGVFSDSGYDPSVRWPHDLYTNKRAAEPFNRPTRMMQAPWGDLYCTDGYGNTAVHRFSWDGKLIRTWGGPGSEPGKFRLPHSLAFDKRERIWVTDRENFRIQIFDKEGNFLNRIERLLYPSEILAYDEYMFLCEGDGQVSIFDLDFNKVAVIGYPGCFSRIHSIGGDASGNIYLGRIEGNDSLIKMVKTQ